MRDTVDTPTWRRCQDAAAAALGLPIITFDKEGRKQFVSGELQEIAEKALSSAIIKELEHGPHSFAVSGMEFSFAPCYVEGNLIAAIIAGPMRTITDHGILPDGTDTIAFNDAFDGMPILSQEKVTAALALVKTLAAVLPEASAFRKKAGEQQNTLRLLLDFSTLLGTRTNIEQLVATTLTFIGRQTAPLDAAIWFGDTRLRLRADERLAPISAEVEQRLLALVVSANNPMHIPDLKRDFTMKGIIGIEKLSSSIYAMPLLVENKAAGMLAIYASPGTAFPTSLLHGIAERLSASLEKAENLRTAQASAVTDALTGLYNKRHFLEKLGTRLQQAHSEGAPTALLLFDIDNFKTYNDSFGHPAGDSLLKQIGTIVRANVLPTDIACRYGGEEFVIIMPDTVAEDAHRRANAIRQAIEAYPFQHRRTTISVGVLVDIKSTSSAQRILDESDKALYNSKRTGKNKVTTVIIVDQNIRPVPFVK